MSFSTVALLLAVAPALIAGAAEPQTTSAPAGEGSNFVGWISQNDRYIDSRTCDFPQTVSTSGNYVQCCPTTGACPFYTACSSNVLLQASGSPVPCDVQASLTCNTGIVMTTSGISTGKSYLACWQTTLSNPFTFVQNIGSATVAPATTTASGSSSGASSTSDSGSTSNGGSSGTSGSSPTSNSAGTTTAASTSASASSSNAAGVIGGGALGAVALIAQAFL